MFVIVLLVIVIVAIHGTKCPKCDRYFGRREIAKRFIKPERFWQQGKWEFTFNCVYCGYVWEKIETETDHDKF